MRAAADDLCVVACAETRAATIGGVAAVRPGVSRQLPVPGLGARHADRRVAVGPRGVARGDVLADVAVGRVVADDVGAVGRRRVRHAGAVLDVPRRVVGQLLVPDKHAHAQVCVAPVEAVLVLGRHRVDVAARVVVFLEDCVDLPDRPDRRRRRTRARQHVHVLAFVGRPRVDGKNEQRRRFRHKHEARKRQHNGAHHQKRKSFHFFFLGEKSERREEETFFFFL